MRISYLVLVVLFSLVGASVHADDKAACKKIWEGCKGNSDMHGCMAQAQKDQGVTCGKGAKGRHGKHHQDAAQPENTGTNGTNN